MHKAPLTIIICDGKDDNNCFNSSGYKIDHRPEVWMTLRARELSIH